MRVIAGIYKGFKLQSFPGKEIRPTPGRIREAIFDIISAEIVGAEFLDLFAGTGAVGIEAISRGAKNVTFVEIDNKAIALIKRNLQKISKDNLFTIIKSDYLRAIRFLNVKQKRFDIVFLDPPYNKNYFLKTLHEIDRNVIIKEGGLIIVQHPADLVVKYDFENIFYFKEKKYGNSKITIFYINYKHT